METAGKGFVLVAREPPMQFVLNEIANPACGTLKAASRFPPALFAGLPGSLVVQVVRDITPSAHARKGITAIDLWSVTTAHGDPSGPV